MIRLLGVRSARKRIFEVLVTMSEAFLGLSALGTQGASAVGRFSEKLEKVQRASTYGIRPDVRTSRDPTQQKVFAAKKTLEQ